MGEQKSPRNNCHGWQSWVSVDLALSTPSLFLFHLILEIDLSFLRVVLFGAIGMRELGYKRFCCPSLEVASVKTKLFKGMNMENMEIEREATSLDVPLSGGYDAI
jgi:hypothetical protein